MADGNLIEGKTTFAARGAAEPGVNWFSDLRFHWDASVTVRKTGVRITLKPWNRALISVMTLVWSLVGEGSARLQ